MILNEEEFKEFIKPLQEINDCMHKAKAHWMNHSEDIFNKSLQDLEMTEEQGNKYQILCEKIGVSIYNLLKVINQTHDNMINLKDKLELNK